jgi:hypothetical protein
MYRETITPLAYSDYSKNVVNAKIPPSAKKIACKYYLGTTVQVHYLNKTQYCILQSNKAALIKKFANLSAGESIILYNHLFTILAA